MMSSKKKQPSLSKNTKHPSVLAPPVPPRPFLAPLRLPKKYVSRDGHKTPTKQLVPNLNYVQAPGNIYFSNSCDDVHKLTRQHASGRGVYGSSHIILGQHIHNHCREGGKMGLFLRSSPSMKLPYQPLVGSQPDIANYAAHRGFWGRENYDLVDRRLLKEPVDRKALREYVDCRALKEDYRDHTRKNGYEVYDRCYDGYNSRYNRTYSSNYTSYHPMAAPALRHPVRKVYSTNSSSSSKSSSKSKSSSYSNEQNTTYARFTFNQCTFRSESPDKEHSSNPNLYRAGSDKERGAPVSSARSPDLTSRNSNRSRNSDRSHGSDQKSDYCPVSDFSKKFPLSAKMTSLHGLPPLPKSLSGVNLQAAAEVNGVERNGERNGGGSAPERKGRTLPTLPTPPASLSQNNVTPVSYVPAANRKPVSLDAQLNILRLEMYGLRQLDLSLLSQLWSLNESIQEFRQLQESISVPSPSDDGEDTDEMLYSNLPPASGRRYRKISRNDEDSSSSSSSVDFGKV